MKKRNGGFTLIELMIAIAVLSTMAAVLLQGFVVGMRMNQKARKEEVVQNLARKTMEEMKGYSFEKLNQMVADAEEGEEGKTVSIAGTEYHYRELPLAADVGGKAGEEGAGPGEDLEGGLHPFGLPKEDTPEPSENGYRLVAEYRRDPASEKADYLIAADIDWGMFSEEDEEGSPDAFSINNYEMPNIVDVDSFLNVVIDPETLVKDDKAIEEELRAKVEGLASKDEEENGGDGTEEDEQTVTVSIESIKKSLDFDVGESDSDSGKLLVKVQAIYTAEYIITESDKNSSKSSSSSEVLKIDLKAYKKNITLDDQSGRPMNRIYLFMPKEDSIKFDKINFRWDTKHPYELFVIAPAGKDSDLSGGFPDFYWKRDDIKINGHSQTEIGADDSECILYTNMAEGDMPVSLAEPERRLYRLTVTVYTAVYEGESSEAPVFGEEVLKLDSTKSE